MTHCPVCQTELSEEQVDSCPTCGWDLIPYPITFQLPDEFLRKEQAKLTWAKQVWRQAIPEAALTQSLEKRQQERFQLQLQILQLQSQLQSIHKQVSTLESQLEQVKSEKEQFQSVRSQLQAQLDFVLSKLQQLAKEGSSSDVNILFSNVEERLENMETRWKQMSRKVLTSWIPNLILELAQGLAFTPDKSTAKAEISDVLQYRKLSVHTFSFLKSIQSALDNQNIEIENLKDYLAERVAEIGEYNLITQVDALLEVRRELKFKGIISDGGPSLYDA
ncbi:hypothetical protein WA1_37755 [Scytonema hofmannii PCC 7110]|uniref:Uncharacterized protein n=1 Tax=Scytonema hofmannii PCC 7110 TaxID=128403 RepID=A0A139X0B1_9CYAN|nr:hypothetical protein [Scytonema hofmannii]KYC38100.1 hypothetical protein WA1_37755 [Scytonema hofmannii PCC 7110]